VHFVDGRAIKARLAVRADDITSVIAMLKEPGRAAEIRALAVLKASQRARNRTVELKLQCRTLRERFNKLSTQCAQIRSTLNQP
jgi:hypothetical protein